MAVDYDYWDEGHRSPETGISRIPQRRIVEKMDEYMSRRDYPGAERHLLYWLDEAQLAGDRRGELMVRNELIGHYRKTGEKQKAYENAGAASHLLKILEYEGSITAGTTYVNIATAYNAFGDDKEALDFFLEAKECYESATEISPALLGGLYNNMGLVYTSLGRLTEALELYEKALEQMRRVSGGELEQAMTYLNMADALEAQLGMENGECSIFSLLDLASELLEMPSVPKDGYYAYVCEKCAPSFDHFGYFFEADNLRKRANEIYERA